MDAKQLTPISSPNRAALISTQGGKDAISRLGKFADWLDTTGRLWHQTDLESYRDYLLTTLAPASVKAHLSTVRQQYRRLIRQRDLFYGQLPPNLSPADAKALVDEMIERLKNAIDPDAAAVKTNTKQDRPDSGFLRLNQAQAEALIRAPFKKNEPGDARALRDAALIALMLATGIRADEACKLTVDDLNQKLDGKLALWVRGGKGNKDRLIPYGSNWRVLKLVERWQARAGIREGFIFRSFNARDHDELELTADAFTPRTLGNLLKLYKIQIDGTRRAVRPHDLRRTYARREYEAGTPLAALQQNLGHSSVETTMHYIGSLDGEARQSRAQYRWQELENLL